MKNEDLYFVNFLQPGDLIIANLKKRSFVVTEVNPKLVMAIQYPENEVVVLCKSYEYWDLNYETVYREGKELPYPGNP